MNNLKSKMDVASRRVQFLQKRIESSNKGDLSYDKAEVAALTSLLSVASLYESTRDGGSHVENTLYLVKGLLESPQLLSAVPAEQAAEVHHAWDKVNESISLIRGLHATKKDTE